MFLTLRTYIIWRTRGEKIGRPQTSSFSHADPTDWALATSGICDQTLPGLWRSKFTSQYPESWDLTCPKISWKIRSVCWKDMTINPCSRVHIKKLLKKFQIQRFTVTFQKAYHWNLSGARWIKSTHSHPIFMIHLTIIPLFMPASPKWPLSFRFPMNWKGCHSETDYFFLKRNAILENH
jgi:hypothetical protein